MTSPRLLVAVAVGGAAGALLRWMLIEMWPDASGFPWTTFGINLTGTFALACLPAIGLVRRSQVLAVAVGPGLLGGYTTLSAYSEQARALFADGRVGLTAAYVGGTLLACLLTAAAASRLSTTVEQREFRIEGGDE